MLLFGQDDMDQINLSIYFISEYNNNFTETSVKQQNALSNHLQQQQALSQGGVMHHP